MIEAKQKLDAGETMESVVEYLNDKYAKMEILLTGVHAQGDSQVRTDQRGGGDCGRPARHSPDFHAQRRREPGGEESARRQGGCQRHGDDDGQPHGAGPRRITSACRITNTTKNMWKPARRKSAMPRLAFSTWAARCFPTPVRKRSALSLRARSANAETGNNGLPSIPAWGRVPNPRDVRKKPSSLNRYA